MYTVFISSVGLLTKMAEFVIITLNIILDNSNMTVSELVSCDMSVLKHVCRFYPLA